MVRVRQMTDMVLTKKEFRIIKKGGHVYKWANKHIHNIYVDRREHKVNKEILKLKAKIAMLEKQTGVRVKGKYTKRNMSFWNNHPARGKKELA
jgi:hypothetical protein